ncbi:hypothetical protein ACIOJE_07205 [Kitasatospora sp. NPDC087861]|uniref:hypothetical protein n=1 Tax=unclassified Kitasatospora TaxID=2633591 RepID=UPI0036567260
MPQINLPPDTPWWFIAPLVLVLVVAVAVRMVAGAILPRQSRDRLSWWKLWFNRPRK